MIFTRLEDGMELKIIPFIRSDGSKNIFLPITTLHEDVKLNIMDDGLNLNKLHYYCRKLDISINISKRFLLNIYTNGEFHFLLVGKSIIDIITHNLSRDFRDDKHLLIKRTIVNTDIGPLSDWSWSYFIDKEWDKPTQDENEWVEILKSRGNLIDDFFNNSKSSFKNNLNYLNKKYDNFFIKLIIEKREEKFKELGI